ncbi:MAG: hypothetical protein H7Z37_13205 [Pyrinomonadaceae bacterium]|nr:hypothetical protein [Pyrinomonadaceae bacterium]
MSTSTKSSDWAVSGTLSANIGPPGTSFGVYGYNFWNKSDNTVYIFAFASMGFGLSIGLSGMKGVTSALTKLGQKILSAAEKGALSQIDYTTITVSNAFSVNDLNYSQGMQASGGLSVVAGYSKTKITAGIKKTDWFLEQDVSGLGLGLGVNVSMTFGMWKYITSM